MKQRVIVTLIAIAAMATACQPRKPVPAQDRAGQTTSPGNSETFESAEKGVAFTYPADWRERVSKDYLIELVPPARDSHVSISLDVPKLPPHIPGFIPLGSVVNGYTDDLKKQRQGIAIDPPASTQVAGANARRVRSSWESSGAELIEIAVLTVHDDRVYIFRANADAAHEDDAVQVLESVLNSVKW